MINLFNKHNTKFCPDIKLKNTYLVENLPTPGILLAAGKWLPPPPKKNILRSRENAVDGEASHRTQGFTGFMCIRWHNGMGGKHDTTGPIKQGKTGWVAFILLGRTC